MNRRERLVKLRELMSREGIDYFVIPTSDPHMSEYVLERFKSRVYMTGFTGSAGYVVVSKDKALLWADGRYHTQAAKQIEGSDFELMKWGLEGVPTYQEWLKANVKADETVGINGEIAPLYLLNELQEILGDKVHFVYDKDLVGKFWEDRPAFPQGKAFILDEKYTGESPTKKLEKIRERMKNEGATHLFLSTLSDIAYTLNIRGTDDLYTPIVVSYLMIDLSGATFFVNEDKIDQSVRSYLQKNGVKILPYDEVKNYLTSLPEDSVIWVSPSQISALNFHLLNEKYDIIQDAVPTTLMKALKNDVQVENVKKAHIIDGGALTRFLCWMKLNVGKVDMDEYSVGEKLHEFRSKGESFISESFATISGYKENAAMAHYSASPEEKSEIKPEGLYLVDSGGQYYEGTTDVTRTIALGTPTEEEKRDYTLTLKGHIDLLLAKFIKGTCGFHLDILARGPMWKKGIDFKHGTGHGVGYCLGVHEGPHSISRALINQPLEPGMIVSDEPGIYREGKHGIRIENLIVVSTYKTTQFGEFYGFENLTYAPYDRDLIDVSLLDKEEIDYIDRYHKDLYEQLISFMVTDEEKEWLKGVTRPLV